MSQKLYEQDFYAWTLQQAELLRSQTQQDLDWANLAEELEDMGKNLKRELESRLKVLFAPPQVAISAKSSRPQLAIYD